MITLLIQIEDDGDGAIGINAMGTNMGSHGEPTEHEKQAVEDILKYLKRQSSRVLHDVEGTLDKGGFKPATRLDVN